MKTSLKGILAIVNEEAIVLSPYQDSGGVWTIGIGHTAMAGGPDPKNMSKIRIDEALSLFAQDLRKFETRVQRAVGSRRQCEFDALVDFDFNTGAIEKGTVDDKLKAGDIKGAMKTLQQYEKDNGRELVALDKRRDMEEAMFLKGEYPNITHFKVYDKYPGKVKLVPVSSVDLSGLEQEPASVPGQIVVEPTVNVPQASGPKKPRGLLLALIELLTSIFKRRT